MILKRQVTTRFCSFFVMMLSPDGDESQNVTLDLGLHISESTRTLQSVSFLRVTLGDAADAVLQLAEKLTSDVVSQATEAVKRGEGATLIDYRRILREVFDLVEDPTITAESLRAKLRLGVRRGVLVILVQ
jgi:hypothetical protein